MTSARVFGEVRSWFDGQLGLRGDANSKDVVRGFWYLNKVLASSVISLFWLVAGVFLDILHLSFLFTLLGKTAKR